jgi:hypothetical protein
MSSCWVPAALPSIATQGARVVGGQAPWWRPTVAAFLREPADRGRPQPGALAADAPAGLVGRDDHPRGQLGFEAASMAAPVTARRPDDLGQGAGGLPNSPRLAYRAQILGQRRPAGLVQPRRGGRRSGSDLGGGRDNRVGRLTRDDGPAPDGRSPAHPTPRSKRVSTVVGSGRSSTNRDAVRNPTSSTLRQCGQDG